MEPRRYETLFLLQPDLPEEEISEIKKKCTDIIDQTQGQLLKLDEWGHRKLAYEIQGQSRGYYFLMDYVGQPAMVVETERQMRLDERVFRYMSVIQERWFNEEKYQQELARQEAEAKKALEEAEARAKERAEEIELKEDSTSAITAADSVIEDKTEDEVEAKAIESSTEEAEDLTEDEAVEPKETSSDSESDQSQTEPHPG